MATKRLFVTVAAACTAFGVHSARAHIDMHGELKGRGGDQKAKPCEGMPRSDEPYRFEPGATIELGVVELVPHDGYFRIAFDNDGTDFKDPQSIAPLNPDRYGEGKKCLGTARDRCGQSDFCNMSSDGNGPTVLWDNLDPHLIDGFSFGQTRTWTVKLPNVECDNCTLQVMQVMEDPAGDAHGPFDGENDLYYRCVDVVLKKGVGKTPGTVSGVPDNEGIDCTKSAPSRDAGVRGDASDPDDDDDDDAADDDDEGGSASAEGGCRVNAAPSLGGALGALLAVMAVAARRRRR